MYIFIYICINQGQDKPAQVVILLIKVYSDAIFNFKINLSSDGRRFPTHVIIIGK